MVKWPWEVHGSHPLPLLSDRLQGHRSYANHSQPLTSPQTHGEKPFCHVPCDGRFASSVRLVSISTLPARQRANHPSRGEESNVQGKPEGVGNSTHSGSPTEGGEESASSIYHIRTLWPDCASRASDVSTYYAGVSPCPLHSPSVCMERERGKGLSYKRCGPHTGVDSAHHQF